MGIFSKDKNKPILTPEQKEHQKLEKKFLKAHKDIKDELSDSFINSAIDSKLLLQKTFVDLAGDAPKKKKLFNFK
jgi:hypothetical protein